MTHLVRVQGHTVDRRSALKLPLASRGPVTRPKYMELALNAHGQSTIHHGIYDSILCTMVPMTMHHGTCPLPGSRASNRESVGQVSCSQPFITHGAPGTPA